MVGRSIVTLLLAAALLGTLAAATPQRTGGASPRGPHGGSVAAVGQYRIEFVPAGYAGFHVYLFDRALHPMSVSSVAGKAVVELDRRKRLVNLILLDPYHLHGLVNISNAARYVITINLKIQGKTYTARFKHSRQAEEPGNRHLDIG